MVPHALATLGLSFRSVAARFLAYRMRIEDEEEEEEDEDEDDEWGIIDVQYSEPQSSAVELTCTIQDIRVSLLIALSPRQRALPHLRLQQSFAKWTFMETEEGQSSTSMLSQAIQVPAFIINFMTATHFESYVADRLEISLHRHIERTSGSRICWTPRLTPRDRAYEGIVTLPPDHESADPDELDTSNDAQVVDTKVAMVTKPKRSFKTFSVNATARYLDYERSAKYIANRHDNIERRHAALSSLTSAKQQRLTTAS